MAQIASPLLTIAPELLVNIASHLDGPSQDTALLVCKAFDRAVTSARIEKVKRDAQRVGRSASDSVSTRLELWDMGFEAADMTNVLRTCATLTTGPVMPHTLRHCMPKAISWMACRTVRGAASMPTAAGTTANGGPATVGARGCSERRTA